METSESLSKKVEKLEIEMQILKSISVDTILDSQERMELQKSLQEYERGEVFTLDNIEQERNNYFLYSA